uniref:Heat shock transcription factor, other eukaryote n=1 Tax=Tetraselmis sp. GSL018 TaxID=582737 RepID=A0A061RKS9_9CHLO
MSGGNCSVPPPFLTKTYDIVSDPATDDIVSWSEDGRSFTVWKPMEFARDLLPKNFKHNNFSSFVRQLNTYGFRKVNPDLQQFENDQFIRGQRHLLSEIQRRKAPPSTRTSSHTAHHAPPAGNHERVKVERKKHSEGSSPTEEDMKKGLELELIHKRGEAIEVGQYGINDEVASLKRDKNILMMELIRLRQQQQASDQSVRKLTERLNRAEERVSSLMEFLSLAMKNSVMLSSGMAGAAQDFLRMGDMMDDSRDHKRPRKSPDLDNQKIILHQSQRPSQHDVENRRGAEEASAHELANMFENIVKRHWFSRKDGGPGHLSLGNDGVLLEDDVTITSLDEPTSSQPDEKPLQPTVVSFPASQSMVFDSGQPVSTCGWDSSFPPTSSASPLPHQQMYIQAAPGGGVVYMQPGQVSAQQQAAAASLIGQQVGYSQGQGAGTFQLQTSSMSLGNVASQVAVGGSSGTNSDLSAFYTMANEAFSGAGNADLSVDLMPFNADEYIRNPSGMDEAFMNAWINSKEQMF